MNTNKFSFLLLLGLIAIFGCGPATDDQSADADQPPNIIIFFSDELSPDYLSTYGGPYAVPEIDQLASSGIRFDRAYTPASMCTPSRFSVMTGQYPGRCKHPNFLANYPKTDPYSVAWNVYLTDSSTTIPRVLSENGYTTGMAGKWHVGTFNELGTGADAGEYAVNFDENDDLDDPEVNKRLKEYQQSVIEKVKKEAGFDYAQSVLWGNFDGFPHPELRFHNFPWITKGAVDFLEKQKDRDNPFFLYVATTAIHGPAHEDALDEDVRYTLEGKIEEVVQYQPDIDSIKSVINGKPSSEQHKISGLAYLNHHIGTVMNKVEEMGVADNTIVLFMADHNVEPGKATCYQKGIHIPMVIHWPGKTKGTTSNDLVQTIDVFPTLLSLAGIPAPNDHIMDGIDMTPIFEELPYERDYIYAEAGYARSVTDKQFQYIAFNYPDELIEHMKTGDIDYAPNQLGMYKQSHSSIAIESYPDYFDAKQLYDLDKDPYQQNNLAYQEEYQEKVKEMENVLQDFLSTFQHPYDLYPNPFRETEKYTELKEETKALGTDYIPWFKPHHGDFAWPPVDKDI